jgi:hypothetical protein
VIETLKLLIQLQRLDTQILSVLSKIEALSVQMQSAPHSLQIAQDAHDRAVEQTAALEKQKRDREGAIDEIGGKLQKLRQRGGEIKTNKEYQAHLKEIEAVQAELTRAEDELLALMEALDTASRSVRDARNVLSAAQQEQEEARKALDRDRKILEDEAASLRGQRKDLVESVDRDTYRRYMEILKLGRGLAVVEAKHEICQGCNLHIPPQLFVEIKPNTEIIQCPQCRRILYFSRSEEGNGPHGASPATT